MKPKASIIVIAILLFITISAGCLGEHNKTTTTNTTGAHTNTIKITVRLTFTQNINTETTSATSQTIETSSPVVFAPVL